MSGGEGKAYDPTTLGRVRAGEQMHFCESGGLWAAMLGGSIQYQSWTPDESRVKGFSEGYNLALRHSRLAFAAPNPPAAANEAVREAILAIEMIPDTSPGNDYDRGWDDAVKAYRKQIRAFPLASLSPAQPEVERSFRERFAANLPGETWANVRANILDGSCQFHSDPENWIAAAAIRATPTSTHDADKLREQGQAEGFAAAVCWLRYRSAMRPPASLWAAAETLADQMEASRKPARFALDSAEVK